MRKIFTFLIAAFFGAATSSQEIDIELFADGFQTPVNLQNAGDDRLFVVEQGGIIKILNADGTTNSTPFLDISSEITSGGERGLLGLAFHPDYQNNGFFFVNYTDLQGDTQVSRFSVSAGDPNIADASSEMPIIDYEQPFGNHNGGCILFGPDGYLYISSGDGGSGGDPGNRAQNTTLLLGKILRIDVDNPTPAAAYGIPADNPFVNDPPNAPEIWAYGVRNPWKFSFDFTENNIWIADVGQGAIEEVNREPVTAAGLNYGWRCYEGSQPYNTANCPPQGDLTFPIAEYSHSVGQSVTGGYVYRGTEFPNLQGIYIFGDFGSGILATVDEAGNYTNLGNFGGSWASFGEAADKTLYAVDYGGNIYKIIDTSLGLEEVEAANFSIFPNPASENVTISAESSTIQAIELFDVKGRLLFSEGNLNVPERNISISTFESGIYFLKISDVLGNSQTKRLIVE